MSSRKRFTANIIRLRYVYVALFRPNLAPKKNRRAAVDFKVDSLWICALIFAWLALAQHWSVCCGPEIAVLEQISTAENNEFAYEKCMIFICISCVVNIFGVVVCIKSPYVNCTGNFILLSNSQWPFCADILLLSFGVIYIFMAAVCIRRNACRFHYASSEILFSDQACEHIPEKFRPARGIMQIFRLNCVCIITTIFLQKKSSSAAAAVARKIRTQAVLCFTSFGLGDMMLRDCICKLALSGRLVTHLNRHLMAFTFRNHYTLILYDVSVKW